VAGSLIQAAKTMEFKDGLKRGTSLRPETA